MSFQSSGKTAISSINSIL